MHSCSRFLVQHPYGVLLGFAVPAGTTLPVGTTLQLVLGMDSPGFQFGPGPAGFHHLGIDLLAALFAVFHLAE